MAVIARLAEAKRRRGFWSCLSGATAVEFGLVVVPVLTLLLGIVDFSLLAWRSSTLHGGVMSLQSAIQQRTADGTNYQNIFCDAAGPLVSCDRDLQIVVRPLERYVAAPRSGSVSTGGSGGATASASVGSGGSDSGASASSGSSGGSGATSSAPPPATPRGRFVVVSGEPFVIEATYRHRMLTPFIDKIVPGRVTETKVVVYAQQAGS